MKHIFLLLSLMLILSCSQGIAKPIEHSLVVTSDKEIISDLDFIENKLFNYIYKSKSSTISIKEIFENSWLSSIKTNYALDQSVSIEIKEHHPIASLGQDKYLTQKGTLIHPKGQFKELKLLSIKGPEDSIGNLINHSRQLQTKLNQLDVRVISFELKNKDQLKAKDDSGTEYIFSLKEFRVQLERLEDYILFELNSGKRNHIRYMDFRYNNAIAVSYS
jgi:cell division septal protein FtsQ